MPHLRWLYPLIACSGIVTGVVAVIVGLVGTDQHLDALSLTISQYAVAEVGGATEFAMIVLGSAAVALVAGLRAAGAPVRGAPERLMMTWSGALLLAAIVPVELNATMAQIHRFLSVAALVALPAAAGLLVSRLAADERWRAVARPVEWLALAGGFGLLAITYAALPGDGTLIGLVEWALLGVEVALLGVLAVRLAQLAWPVGAGALRRISIGWPSASSARVPRV
ncbi:DUF998 domain-containing protein [Streptosporangium sp. KLBMP 9127]|nr:DUF998 domain-containing protein [Streptosporangium sp. KLBMP 9127]